MGETGLGSWCLSRVRVEEVEVGVGMEVRAGVGFGVEEGVGVMEVRRRRLASVPVRSG